MKLPFAFPLASGGNAYDFSEDLATVVYAWPNAHADLYLLDVSGRLSPLAFLRNAGTAYRAPTGEVLRRAIVDEIFRANIG
jgi:hypothetical protein